MAKKLMSIKLIRYKWILILIILKMGMKLKIVLIHLTPHLMQRGHPFQLTYLLITNLIVTCDTFNENQLHAVEDNAPPAAPPPLPKATGPTSKYGNLLHARSNFRKSNHTVRKQTTIPGTWVLGVSIFLLILLGGGLYMYWLRPPFLDGIFGSKQTTPAAIPQDLIPVVSNDTNPVLEEEVAVVPASSAKQVYVTFRTELASTATPDQYLAIYSKYATATKYETVKSEKRTIGIS